MTFPDSDRNQDFNHNTIHFLAVPDVHTQNSTLTFPGNPITVI